MYNLFVSGNEDAWSEYGTWTISGRESTRWLNEYTDDELGHKYTRLSDQIVAELRSFPCLFCYEKGLKLNPHFGVIRTLSPHGTAGVSIEYRLFMDAHELTHEKLTELSPQLDIHRLELHRTHWALKRIDLARELSTAGISAPEWTVARRRRVDLRQHEFEVALSFPGEQRELVSEVADRLEVERGPDTYFYDFNYQAQLARPSLDVLLNSIYRERSKLVVVFVSDDYQKKRWCGLEFRAIKEHIFDNDHDRVMFVRIGSGEIEDMSSLDGYVDASRHSPSAIAHMISERVDLLLNRDG